MKRIQFIFLFLLFSFYACNNEETKPPQDPEYDIGAAREFIRAALDGQFDKARNFMLQDSLNMQFMDAAERSYERTDKETRYGYKSSSIRIYSPVVPVNDSTTIVVYSNSFKNDKDTLRVVRVNNRWLVDLKYLYQHDLDTSNFPIPLTDTIK
jgi:hypothetical protein